MVLGANDKTTWWVDLAGKPYVPKEVKWEQAVNQVRREGISDLTEAFVAKPRFGEEADDWHDADDEHDAGTRLMTIITGT